MRLKQFFFNPWDGGSSNNHHKKKSDYEDLLKKAKEKWKDFPPKKNIGFFVLILFGLFCLYLATGFYKIQPDEQGVVLRFGQWIRTNYDQGLHYHLPYPVETVLKPKVTRENKTEVGFTQISHHNEKRISERRMITGDENFIDIQFAVLWRIKDAGSFLFNIRNPEKTIKEAAESAMRDTIGHTTIQLALTEGKNRIESEVKKDLQNLLDAYKAGVEINRVALLNVDPPEPVNDSFNEVQRAKTDKERMRNEAERYRNDIIPRARGEAEKIIQEAQGYKEAVVNKAEGESEKFEAVFKAYNVSKDITQKRLYLETMEKILAHSKKVVVNSTGQVQSVLPYLPLPELKKNTSRQIENMQQAADKGEN